MAFEFGIDLSGYRALRRVLQTKPFETLGAGACRYYFVPSVCRLPDSEVAEFEVESSRAEMVASLLSKGLLASWRI